MKPIKTQVDSGNWNVTKKEIESLKKIQTEVKLKRKKLGYHTKTSEVSFISRLQETDRESKVLKRR